MADGDLLLMLNEDGKFELYNPEFDIIITCKSKEEINGLVEYGDTVVPTENNLATQTAYRCSLHIIEKHLGELQQQEEQE